MAIERDKLSILSKFELFSEYADKPGLLEKLGASMDDRKYQAREAILNEASPNGPDAEMFFLYEGRLAVNKIATTGKIVKLAKFEGTDLPFFGEGAILGSDRRTANVEAETPARCFVITSSKFFEFTQNHPEGAVLVYRRLAQRLHQRLEHLDKDLLYLGSR